MMLRYLFFLILILLCAPAIAGQGFVPFGYVGSAAAPTGISDNFSSAEDPATTNYTAISGAVLISAGTLGGKNAWTADYAYHKTATGSNDHYVRGKIQTGGMSAGAAGAAIGLRCNGTTGYLGWLNNDASRFYLNTFNGTSLSTSNYIVISTPPGAGSYGIKITVVGSTFHVYADWNNDGTFETDLGTWSNSTYTTGQYVVVGALRGNDNGDYRVDDLGGGL